MKTKNRTPFAVMTFASQSLTGTPFQTVVVKGTFDIEKDAPLRVAAEQEPIRAQDVPFADAASLRYEDDLAPFKPLADVIVIATAHAPGGKASAQWYAGVRVGSLEKRVRVTGPRAWVHTPLLGWGLSPIVPVRSAPVRYELAFGGAGCEENPVGVGFIDPRKADRKQAIPAPQILPPDGRDPVFGERIPVEGFSAIPRAWQPRRARGGALGEPRSPDDRLRLPPDFDPTYYNAAHVDLIGDDFLRGDEEVRLDNLHPEHACLAFRLPALIVAAAVVARSGFRYGGAARLDTLLIDAERMRAELTWRATLPLYEHGVARVDVATREAVSAALSRAVVGGVQ